MERLWVARGKKGFTLLELLVCVAIIGAGAHTHWNGVTVSPADSWTIDHLKVLTQLGSPN